MGGRDKSGWRENRRVRGRENFLAAIMLDKSQKCSF